jgi:uncharacterized membrane protein YfcA
MLLAGLAAGLVAGFVLGFLGAGGTVVGLPILLYFSGLQLRTVLGSNALGVSLIALALLAWRLYRRELRVAEAVTFAMPGLLGIYVGVQLGLVFPGQRLIFLLSIVLVVVAGWMFYLSTRQEATAAASDHPSSTLTPPNMPLSLKRLIRMAPIALVIGIAAGFFGIGGGFMIVPALIIAGDLTLREAAATSLLPIAAFSALVGIEYWAAHTIDLNTTGFMLGAGILGGVTGVWLATRLPKKIMQRVFATALVLIGAYMAFH